MSGSEDAGEPKDNRSEGSPPLRGEAKGAGAEERQLAPEVLRGEGSWDRALRPRRFEDYIGQRRVKEKLQVFVAAALERGEPLDHCLLCGPPGLGKTTLALIIAEAMGVKLHISSGPALERKGDLAALLTQLDEGDILFIDEIHRLSPILEENLYPALEDYRLDIMIGEGPMARSVQIPLAPFTLIGATTSPGRLTAPLRDRFGIIEHLEFYGVPALQEIALRSADRLQLALSESAAEEVARRSRGTPRITNRLLRRLRDFAQVKRWPLVGPKEAVEALELLDVDQAGFDRLDRRLLLCLIEHFSGGPAGLETLAAAVGEDKHTIEDAHEPFLIQEGYLQRTPRGRVATAKAFEHFKHPWRGQGMLL